MKFRTLTGLALKGKRVLLRTDFNVPLQDGKVQDATRLRESLPTLRYLIENGAKVTIVSHLGRPKGKVDPLSSLAPVAEELSRLLGQPVIFAGEGDLVLRENLRFHPGEEANDPAFCTTLVAGMDLYVNDAFGTLHRAHASTEGVARLLPSYAGFLVEKEVNILSKLMENPRHPVYLVVGGAKVDTKIGILEKFLNIADVFIIGGALANTFLKAKGVDIGASLCEDDKLEVAKKFLNDAKGKMVLLPIDYVISENKILDLGPQTIELFTQSLEQAATIIWNGPMGLYETEAFAEGTKAIAVAIAKNKGETVLGGGDTVDAVHHFAIPETSFTHLSTGGGAMLEFLEGKSLPGLEALLSK